MLLYGDLVSWYRMFTPPSEYAGEAASYRAAFDSAVTPPPRTLLELGAGAGHNAFHLKQRFQCTLTDLSPEMLARSQGLNPECEHLAGDMRAIRLGRRRDACLFAATGAAAIATKDQAYGFFVIPAVLIVFNTFRAHKAPSRPHVDKQTVFAMAAVFAGVMLILFNVPFNLIGVRDHLRLIVGPGSAPFRMYPSSPVGYLHLLADGVWQMGSAMSWPMFIVGIIGVASAIRLRTVLVTRLLLFAI